MKVPYQAIQELILLFSGNQSVWPKLQPLLLLKHWQDEHTTEQINDVLNLIRPFAVLRFSDPEKFLGLIKNSPKELEWAAEKPARVQKCIVQLEAALNPQPLQLPPGGGSMWLGLSLDDPFKDINLDDD